MIYFIVNPTARTGNSKSVWNNVKAYLKYSDIPYKAFKTTGVGHATELAKQISNLTEGEKDVKLVVVGGDGTINEVLNGITDFEHTLFGVIPSGSGNDFAKGAGIEWNLQKNIEIINEGRCEPCDIGRVVWNETESRYYGISSGLGLDAIVCKKALTSKLKKFLNKIKLGKLTYILLTVGTLFSMKTSKGKMKFVKADVDGQAVLEQREFEKLIFSASMNVRAEGGGVKMAPNAKTDNGCLTMCSAHDVPKWKTFFLLPFLAAGKHTKFKCFDILEYKECNVEISEPVVLHADGEYLGDVTEARFICEPGKLKLMR